MTETSQKTHIVQITVTNFTANFALKVKLF